MKKNSGVLESYVLPRLAADHIKSPESGVIELHNQGRILKIDVEGDQDAASDLLNRLKDPSDEIWKLVSLPGHEELSQTVGLLDKYGWLEDCNDSGKAGLQTSQDNYNDIGNKAGNWIIEALATTGRLDESKKSAFQSLLIYFLNDSRSLINELLQGKRSVESLSQLHADGLNSIGAKALMLCLRAWQRSSPRALWAFNRALNIAVETFAREKSGLLQHDADLAALSGVEDVNDVRNQVWSACCLLLQALNTNEEGNWKRYLLSEIDGDSGINTVIQAEAAAESLISSLGETELLNVIQGQTYVHRCAAGVFLHQYFITIRYLESILSFLRYRMHKNLRTIGFEYLLEEIGHDVHEREACIRLGLSNEDIDGFAPLPLFEVYSDILSYFAEVNPVSFCLSVIVAEGMPGQKKLIADALAEQGLDDPDLAVHTELDMELNHSYYPRKLMSSLPWISKKARLEALQNFLFTLELSQLGWKQMARYAAQDELYIVPKAFAITPDQVLSLVKTD